MRKALLLAVLTISSTTAATALAGNDDLFSRVRLDSTSTSGGTDARPAPAPQEERQSLSGLSELQSTLLAAGYTARNGDNDDLTIEMSRSDWTAAVTLRIINGGTGLQLAMQLTTPEQNTVIAPKTLRGLLEENGRTAGAFFAITGDPQRIELNSTISNAGIDSERLRSALEAMADMAERTKDTWKVAGVRIRTAESTTPTSTTKSEKVADAVDTALTGKWIASPNTNEAFALQLDTGDTFRLVHVKGTTSSKSTGKYTLANGTLSLKGDDGKTLAGSVARQSDGFTLSLNGAGGKTVTLNFKSGS